jgi:competence transcription factor ComK
MVLEYNWSKPFAQHNGFSIFSRVYQNHLVSTSAYKVQQQHYNWINLHHEQDLQEQFSNSNKIYMINLQTIVLEYNWPKPFAQHNGFGVQLTKTICSA